MPGHYVLLTPDFVIENITAQYAATAGIKVKQAIGKSIFELLPEGNAQHFELFKHEVSVSLEQVVSLQVSHTIPFLPVSLPQPAVSGGHLKEYYWKITNTPILSDNGELLHVLHHAEDITETLRQQERHHQNEEKLAMLNNALHTVSWEYDIINDVLTWDHRLQQVFGYVPEEMDPSGASWDKLVHPDDFQEVQQSIARATASGKKLWTGEYRMRKADGTYAHVLDQGYFLYDSNNKPLRTFGTIIDLSQNKRTEEELKESDARFRQLLENLPHMAWTADPKGKVLYFNDNWYKYTGMPKGQTDGWASVIHPDDTASVLTAWHDAVSSGNLYEIEYRIRDHITGTYRYFMERGVPMLDQTGQIKLWVGTFTDIEDQKQTLESIRLKDQQLLNLLNISPAHLCLLEGPNYVCRYVSPGIYRMYGNRSYIGLAAEKIWPEFGHLGLLSILNHVYHQGETLHRSEINLMYDRFQDGQPQEAYFNFKYQPIFSDHGQIEGVLISAVEVTELAEARKKAESLAKELEEKLNQGNQR
ncbi:MAG: PAS domain-containing protein [Hymenobacteraceae bacterium]|nr:PAS domain-containing protein [Hymenobacteraceae bacterium]